MLRPEGRYSLRGRIPPIEPHFRRGWFPAEKEGPSRETRTFFLFLAGPDRQSPASCSRLTLTSTLPSA
nr:MAG TPA: hypothetical protein [Caudoviricetes sp.]